MRSPRPDDAPESTVLSAHQQADDGPSIPAAQSGLGSELVLWNASWRLEMQPERAEMPGVGLLGTCEAIVDELNTGAKPPATGHFSPLRAGAELKLS